MATGATPDIRRHVNDLGNDTLDQHLNVRKDNLTTTTHLHDRAKPAGQQPPATPKQAKNYRHRLHPNAGHLINRKSARFVQAAPSLQQKESA